MKGDKSVIGALLDSMIMNLRKDASVSLSEESDSFKLCLNFLFEKEAMSLFFTSSVLQNEKEIKQWVTYLPWLSRGYNTSILKLRARF